MGNRRVARVRLVHWKPEEAWRRVEQLADAGYDVAYEPFDPNTLRGLAKDPPDAFVIDLTRLPSHGRDVGIYVRERKATRRVPIVFVGGAPDKVSRARERLPDAVYAAWEDAAAAIEEAIADPPEHPVVPASALAGYSGTPLPKKLGIKQGLDRRAGRRAAGLRADPRRAAGGRGSAAGRRRHAGRHHPVHQGARPPGGRRPRDEGVDGRRRSALARVAQESVGRRHGRERAGRAGDWPGGRPWSTTRSAPSTPPGPACSSPAARRDEAAANAGGALTYYRDTAAPRRRAAETVDAGVDCIDSDQTGPIGYRRNHTMELERVASQRG